MECVHCGKAIESGDYQLVGIEAETWRSRYAHRGMCVEAVREALAATMKPRQVRAVLEDEAREEPEVEELVIEELTLDEPEPVPNEDLPWFGTEWRR